jgi:hypothetical protein
MRRRSSHERETLRISADAAEKLILELRKEIEEINVRIGVLQTIVDANAEMCGKRLKSHVGANGTAKKRAPKGQVPKHIEEILRDGGELEEPELRKAIFDRFGVSYGRATVYTCLRRGLDDHKFVKNGKKWSLNPMRMASTSP